MRISSDSALTSRRPTPSSSADELDEARCRAQTSSSRRRPRARAEARPVRADQPCRLAGRDPRNEHVGRSRSARSAPAREIRAESSARTGGTRRTSCPLVEVVQADATRPETVERTIDLLAAGREDRRCTSSATFRASSATGCSTRSGARRSRSSTRGSATREDVDRVVKDELRASARRARPDRERRPRRARPHARIHELRAARIIDSERRARRRCFARLVDEAISA